MRILLVITAILWSVFPVWPATGQYTVTTSAIVAALSKAGVDVGPDRVALMADVVATTPSPALKVSFVGQLQNRQMVARIECGSNQECLPFYVGVKPEPNATQAVSPAPARPAAFNTFQEQKTIVMRTGNTATLQLDGEHVHITIPVTCLENGAVGQIIRVTDKNRRLVYRAQVMEDGLVKGRLR